jgi:hypothetical protein
MEPDWLDGDVHGSFHTRLHALMGDRTAPLEDRVRFAASLGVVASVLGFPGADAFDKSETDELKGILSRVIGDVLRVELREETPGAPNVAGAVRPEPLC